MATLTVTTNLDSGDDQLIGASLDADIADGGGLSLREAINWAASGDEIILTWTRRPQVHRVAPSRSVASS